MNLEVSEPLAAGPRLRGRRIIVTGAASGMGRAVAELFTHEGARLVLLDNDAGRLRDVAGRLGAHAIATDISEPASVAAAVAEVDHQDLWQRAAIGVAVVSGESHHVTEMLEAVRRQVEGTFGAELIDWQVRQVSSEDSGEFDE